MTKHTYTEFESYELIIVGYIPELSYNKDIQCRNYLHSSTPCRSKNGLVGTSLKAIQAFCTEPLPGQMTGRETINK